jgi:ribulose 1,5-bisphosphate carboxylase large subunit-like protein
MTRRAVLPTEEVLALHSAGHSTTEISRRYGCAYSAVYRLLRRAGVDTRPQGTAKGRIKRHRAVLQGLLEIMEQSLRHLLAKGVEDPRTERLRAQIHALREVIK